MAEVLENLLSNAIKYSPDGGEVRVDAGAARPRAATVSVRDHGIGIARPDRERLFRPFSRVRDRRTAAIEGSGLGLYICDRIVRAHGGRLSVESEPGEGSAFSFSLPLYGAGRADEAAAGAGGRRGRADAARGASRGRASTGFGTHEVCDGVEAVEAALRLVPAAVILDRVLPRLSAPQVAERLRENVATEVVRSSRWPARTSWATTATSSRPSCRSRSTRTAGGGARRAGPEPSLLTR